MFFKNINGISIFLHNIMNISEMHENGANLKDRSVVKKKNRKILCLLFIYSLIICHLC